MPKDVLDAIEKSLEKADRRQQNGDEDFRVVIEVYSLNDELMLRIIALAHKEFTNVFCFFLHGLSQFIYLYSRLVKFLHKIDKAPLGG